MTEKLRAILLRQSETREGINEAASAAEPDEAKLTELRNKAQAIEKELREALSETDDHDDDAGDAGAAVDAEERERRELRGRAGLHRFVGAALQTGDAGGVDGAEAEYSAAMGCPGLVPLTMFGGTMEQRQAEHRTRRETRAVTPAPADSDVPHTHAPIVPALFDRSIAGYLGIEMPTVGTGIASYPVLSTSVQGGMVAEDGDAANAAGAFTVADADPRRLTGSFTIRKEDIAKLPNLEEALRGNLNAVLSDEFDKQGVNGDGNAPNLNGLLAQLTNPNPAVPAAVETYASYQAALSSHIDGLFATMPGDVRALIGVDTIRHMLGVYRADEDAATAYDLATEKYGGVRASRRIPAIANKGQQAIVRRSNPAGDRVAVAPVWMGVELIRDVYGNNAKKGHVTVTGTALVGGIVLLREGAFVQDSFRLVA